MGQRASRMMSFRIAGARDFPPSSPGEDNEVRGLFFGQAQDFRGGIAVSEEYPHVQVAERANACESLDKLTAPGGPFVLRLIDITWRGERAGLCREQP